MKFKLSGSELTGMRMASVLPLAKRIARWLNSRPDGELYTTKEVCMHAAISTDRLLHVSSDPELAAVRMRFPGRPLWWGSEKTITEAKKELA